jgi:hypothetical protein
MSAVIKDFKESSAKFHRHQVAIVGGRPEISNIQKDTEKGGGGHPKGFRKRK